LVEKLGFVQGALILTIANLISKFLGFVFRIVLSNKIGPEGMGVYQLVMPIYITALSITTGGISVTVSKLVAQSTSRGGANTRKIIQLSLMLIIIISVAVCSIIMIWSKYISINILKDERTLTSIFVFAPALFIISSSAVIRGYFEGIQNIKPTATANIIEELFKIGFILFIIDAVLPMGIEYAVAASVLSSIIGEIAGFIYMSYRYKVEWRSIKISKSVKPMASTKIISRVIGTTFPLSLNRFVNTLLQSVESVIIPQRLMINLSKQKSLSIFGELSGMALPIVMLPSIVVNSLSVTLIPAIAEAHEKNDMPSLEHRIDESVCYTIIVSFATSALLLSLSNEIAIVLYHNAEVGKFMKMFSFVIPFMYLSHIMTSTLNGMGKQKLTLLITSSASIIRTLCTYYMVAQPALMVNGYFIGYYLSFFILFLLSYISVRKFTAIKIDCQFFIKTLMSCLFFYINLKILYHINPISNGFINLVTTICISLVIYLLTLIFTGAIKKDNLLKIFPFPRRI